MGEVYEASHLRLSRRFVVKLLYPQVSDNPEALARFRREAEVTSAIGHPHIVEVIDFNYNERGAPYIVMEFLDGEDLSERLKRVGKLSLTQALNVFFDVASALQAAHDKGIVHRDLKPQNIYLCKHQERDDFAKVVDFGISKVLGSQSVVTKSGALIGTPNYMAPEQAQDGSDTVDQRADIYAMGVILYEMLAGRPPFIGDNIPAVLYKIVHEPPPALLSLNPDVPIVIEEAIGQALQKKREARYASMSEFSKTLRRVVGISTADFDARLTQGIRTIPKTLDPKAISSTLPPKNNVISTLSGGATAMAERDLRLVSRSKTVSISLLVGAALVGISALVFFSRNQPTDDRDRLQLLSAASSVPASAHPNQHAKTDAAIRDEKPNHSATQRTLSVDSSPKGALVLLNDTPLGETPLRAAIISTEQIEITIQANGYVEQRVLIAAGNEAIQLKTVSLKKAVAVKPKTSTSSRLRAKTPEPATSTTPSLSSPAAQEKQKTSSSKPRSVGEGTMDF